MSALTKENLKKAIDGMRKERFSTWVSIPSIDALDDYHEATSIRKIEKEPPKGGDACERRYP